MKLRWFSMCNEHGVWTERVLQYWNEEEHRWQDVHEQTCKTWEEDECMTMEPFW